MRRLLTQGALLFLLAMVTAGCSAPPTVEITLHRLSPEAPAAAGLPPRPHPQQPIPAAEEPFGLYAEPPNPDTLSAISTGHLSPDGRFRATLTDDGVWVGRIDGIWYWHVDLPLPVVPAPPPERIGPEPPPPPPPAPPVAVSPLRWTNQGTLLIRDQNSVWYEADPVLARVEQLPAWFAGKDLVTFSPDHTQVFYYENGPTGQQLWVSEPNGANPRLVGENVIGRWDEHGQIHLTPVLSRHEGDEVDAQPGAEGHR